MAKKTKELCKWEKGCFEKELAALEAIAGQPRYACKTCGRVARDKKYLCKPLRFAGEPGPR